MFDITVTGRAFGVQAIANQLARICYRAGAGGEMALKIASLGSSKHYSLQHQLDCLLRLKSLWGQCVPHVVLAGELTAMQHGYGLGTALIRGRHPRSGMHIKSHGGYGTCLSTMCEFACSLCGVPGNAHVTALAMQAILRCCQWLRMLWDRYMIAACL